MRSKPNMRGSIPSLGRLFEAAVVVALLPACGGSDSWAPEPEPQEVELEPFANALLSDTGVECFLQKVEGSDSTIEMTLVNRGSLPVEILARSTLWDQGADVLSVTQGAEELAYRGVIAFRLPPTDADYKRLDPGGELAARYDVEQGYALNGLGSYELQLRSPIVDARVNGVALLLQQTCGTLEVSLGSDAVELGQSQQPLVFTDSTCTSDEQVRANRIDERARLAVNVARRNVTANNAYYARWFGAFGVTNSTFVAARLDQMISDWTTYTSDCRQDPAPPAALGCSQSGTVAWALPSVDSKRLHLCSNFLVDQPTFVSQVAWLGGIVAHEKAHLTGAPFDDYGVATVKTLAQTDPARAVRNGPSYGYFVSDAYVTGTVLMAALAPLL